MGSGDEAAAGTAGNIHLALQAGDMMAQAMVAQAMAAHCIPEGFDMQFCWANIPQIGMLVQ
jgi:hypothetical protein